MKCFSTLIHHHIKLIFKREVIEMGMIIPVTVHVVKRNLAAKGRAKRPDRAHYVMMGNQAPHASPPRFLTSFGAVTKDLQMVLIGREKLFQGPNNKNYAI